MNRVANAKARALNAFRDKRQAALERMGKTENTTEPEVMRQQTALLEQHSASLQRMSKTMARQAKTVAAAADDGCAALARRRLRSPAAHARARAQHGDCRRAGRDGRRQSREQRGERVQRSASSRVVRLFLCAARRRRRLTALVQICEQLAEFHVGVEDLVGRRVPLRAQWTMPAD